MKKATLSAILKIKMKSAEVSNLHYYIVIPFKSFTHVTNSIDSESLNDAKTT